MEHKITIPINEENEDISSDHSFIIIGANGSGKSRLGKFIEDYSVSKKSYRISAQRALNIPDFIPIKSYEESSDLLMYGSSHDGLVKQKNKIQKWGDKYENRLINDYANTLSAVYALKNIENDDFVKKCKIKEEIGGDHPKAPITIIDHIVEIWKDIMPYRKIKFDDAKVVAVFNDSAYKGKDLSDGERVALYLLAQSLCLPDGYTIIIDEPEIHLHKSIMIKLWDKIEEYCPNKTFVYITHDLDFASSRKSAKKIWVKSFDGNKWDIELLPDVEGVPESLIIEILGNRKNVIFVEGEKGSFDFEIYKHIYSDFYVVPCGNCRSVIQNTKAFRNMEKLHKLNIHGIIDHDYRTDAEINNYTKDGIYVLDIAEIENLFCIEGVIRLVAEHQVFSDVDNKVKEVEDYVFTVFKDEYDNQLCSVCEREIQHKLQQYKKSSAKTKEALQKTLEDLCSSIDVDKIYSETKEKIDEIIKNKNYNGLLKIFNRKKLYLKISTKLGLLNTKEDNYAQLILRVLRVDKDKKIVKEMAKFTPTIEN